MPQTLPLSVNAPAIQWYPGHIAKAEKALSANLAKVDLVIEVRDARIPMATSHPRLQRWIGNKQHLLVLNRVDMIPPPVRQAWTAWFRTQEQTCWWCDAKAGTGVKQLQQAAIRAGVALNVRRAGRGMKPRPVRALMLGFPNVGKSALINRLVHNRVDMIPPPVRQAWTAWFRAQEQTCWWCDAKAGTGVKQLQQAAIRA
ncbi:MAG: 50S ribosome-binding GTPase, partial [Cyanobium usitatum Tobar12.5m-G36]|nr:50S ribosome-binding GTPase [Cyanobium usitatum Tobar12.5m-G36]